MAHNEWYEDEILLNSKNAKQIWELLVITVVFIISFFLGFLVNMVYFNIKLISQLSISACFLLVGLYFGMIFIIYVLDIDMERLKELSL